MRQALFLLLAVSVAACASLRPGSGPEHSAVAVIGSESLSLEDFEAQYVRSLPDSASAATHDMAEYEDFLERYVDFRLKVMEADSAGYDEREDLKTEMAQYRGQLARPYLLEREVVEPLIQDLWDKKQEMVDVSHILIRVDADAPTNDTLRAYDKIAQLADSARSGVDFGTLAAQHSEDPSAGQIGRPGYRGHLGYYSGGRMVKQFEDRMFSTPVDSISEIFRTQFGYHFLKVHDRKPAVPERRLAHIMIQPRGQSAADTADAGARLDSVLARLQAGDDFGDVAREMSDDRQSSSRGGDLDFIAFDGWLPAPMRDAAFGIDSLNAVSDPVTTPFGTHVVQFLGERELPTFDEAFEGLKNEISRLPRSNQAEREYAATIRKREGARIDSAWVNEILGTSSADSALFALSSNTADAATRARTVASLGDSVYTAGQLGAFAASYREGRDLNPQARLWATLDAFLDDRAVAWEVSALEARDENFRRTMKEFREGLMLFRLMEDSVWTAANQDSAALETYYAANAGDYNFPDRFRILGVASSSDSLVQVIHGLLEAGTPYAAVVEAYATDSLATVRFDTTYVEGETSSIYDQAVSLEVGAHTDVLAYSGGRIVLVNDGIDPARPKSFDEARAEVVAAYQEVLEDRLIARLRALHQVSTYPERLVNAFGRGQD